MLAATEPANETQRLAELHALAILDTPREERFDAIVRLAQAIFRVPIVYIALIDADRQWFKAKCGLSADETARDVSFCGHAILGSELLLIPDARLDQRFHDNPLVTGDPFVRFYAGYPLPGPHGLNVGTLCLADREPRTLTTEEQAVLRSLARMTAEQLQLVNLVTSQQRLLEMQHELLETQRKLDLELREAGDYLRSLLPERLNAGPVLTNWAFQTSSQLGGDLFGYHWLDDEHFVVFLFDVCGHGVGASLLASSVHSALSRKTLPDCDFSSPAQVIAALDAAFPMDKHHDKFFTIWYGVYHHPSRQLRFTTAGHHPATFLGADTSTSQPLGRPDLMVGIATHRAPHEDVIPIPEGSRLYLFSDGVFELHGQAGDLFGLDRLNQLIVQSSAEGCDRVAHIQSQLTEWTNGEQFTDDFSMVEFQFGARPEILLA